MIMTNYELHRLLSKRLLRLLLITVDLIFIRVKACYGLLVMTIYQIG